MKIKASSDKFKQVDRHSLLHREVGPQSRTTVYTCHEVLFYIKKLSKVKQNLSTLARRRFFLSEE